MPFWEAGKHSFEIDPSEILNNLDALSPSCGIGDVFIKGRFFDVGSIDVSSLQPTADVFENQILLGGLYSIRKKISRLQSDLSYPSESVSEIGHYESFQHWMLQITVKGMLNRCHNVMQITTELIKLFEHRLKVKYIGEISPILTPYSRGLRVYRSLFTQLSHWYSLGQPSLGGLHFLMKLRSLSKIYEFFVFFHLLDHLIHENWEIVDNIPHPTMGEDMPSVVFLNRHSAP